MLEDAVFWRVVHPVVTNANYNLASELYTKLQNLLEMTSWKLNGQFPENQSVD